MRYSDPNRPVSQMDIAESAEERLLRENRELRRQLEEYRHGSHDSPAPRLWRPSRVTLTAICLAVAVLTAGAFLAGYVPLRQRKSMLAAEARDSQQALPRVEVITVGPSSTNTALSLPGSMQAITE